MSTCGQLQSLVACFPTFFSGDSANDAKYTMSGRLWWWLSWLGELGKRCASRGGDGVMHVRKPLNNCIKKITTDEKRDHSIWSKSEIIPTITLRSCSRGQLCVVSRVCGYSDGFSIPVDSRWEKTSQTSIKCRQCSKSSSNWSANSEPITNAFDWNISNKKEIMFIKCPLHGCVCVRMW